MSICPIEIRVILTYNICEVIKLEIYKEILSNILEKEDIIIEFKNLEINPAEIINLSCYRAICDIKTIIKDNSLSDKECFMKIENIVSLFESLGIDCGSRHDFG